ncbi:hypothetical protein VPHD530_0042 [Vibrio phage D530]
MSRSKQEVFNEVYITLEEGKELPRRLSLEARHHGIRVTDVQQAVSAAEESDFDDG